MESLKKQAPQRGRRLEILAKAAEMRRSLRKQALKRSANQYAVLLCARPHFSRTRNEYHVAFPWLWRGIVDFNKLIARVKNILLTPETVQSLYLNYILILAAIPAICGFIKMSVFGISIPFVGTTRVGFFTGITNMVLTYAVSLGIAFLVALIIDMLAPNFGGQK